MNTEINYTNMELKTIAKNIKKITNKVSSARPVLQNMYLDNNTIVATDSHRLIRINYEHNKTNQLISPKNNEVVDSIGNYPSVERIIPVSENANNVITINSDEIDLIISVLKAYKHLKIKTIELSLNNEESYYTLNKGSIENLNREYMKGLEITYRLLNQNITNKITNKLILTTEYFLHAMEFLKDYDKDTVTNVEYKIYIYDNLTPILISTQENDFQYVICPVRRY